MGTTARRSAEGGRRETTLAELALLFLRLGATAFGGPAAHVALMEEEVVRRRSWLTSEQFLDLLGASNLIPGPNSTELAIHIGHARRGFPGLVVAGLAFIVPAALVTLAFAWVYVRVGEIPAARGALYGIKPVMIGIVGQALWSLAPKAAKSWPLRGLGVLAASAVALGIHELAVLFAAGALVALLRLRRPGPPATLALWLTLGGSAKSAVAATAASPSLAGLFLFFAKVGAVLFGSGYVLLAFLRADLVDRWSWLTEPQLLDAIAVGQFTPGPVFTTATFIGYVIAGGKGALCATAGIFLPAFFFVAISGPLVPRLRRSRIASGFLDGVNVASLSLMAVVGLQLARAALVDMPALLLFVLSLGLMLRFKINSAWLVLGGAVAGSVLAAFR